MIHPLLFGATGLSFVYFIYPNWFVKALPIWCAGFASFLRHRSTYSNTVAMGLLASSLGDIFLEMDDDYGIDLFIPGLLSFLVAHLCYIRAFQAKVASTSWVCVFPIVAAYYFIVMSRLLPKAEQDLQIPVAVYGLAISAMMFLACNRLFAKDQDARSTILSLLGSLSFVASDTVLAFNKFHSPIHDAKKIIMITYYAGQLLIAGSTQFVSPESKMK